MTPEFSSHEIKRTSKYKIEIWQDKLKENLIYLNHKPVSSRILVKLWNRTAPLNSKWRFFNTGKEMTLAAHSMHTCYDDCFPFQMSKTAGISNLQLSIVMLHTCLSMGKLERSIGHANVKLALW